VIGVHDMESYVPVQHFRHQGIERTAASGNRVQDFRAVSLALDSFLNCFHLTTNPADAIKHLLLVPKYVSQKPPPNILI